MVLGCAVCVCLQAGHVLVRHHVVHVSHNSKYFVLSTAPLRLNQGRHCDYHGPQAEASV